MPSAATLMTVETVADDLGVEPLAVRRLIARGRLKAHRVGPTERGGEPGPWLVKAEDFTAYVDRGTPDLAPPTVQGGWPREAWVEQFAGQFLAEVKAAITEQLPAEHPGRDRVEARVTKAVRAAMRAPWRGPRLPGKFYDGIADARTAWLVEELRRTALEVARREGKALQPPLETLYDGPAAYTRITGEAVTRVKEGVIALDRDYADGLVTLILPHAALMTGNATALALDAAF